MIIFPGCPQWDFFEAAKANGSEWVAWFKPAHSGHINEMTIWLTDNIGENYKDWIFTEFTDGVIGIKDEHLTLFLVQYGHIVKESYCQKYHD